MTKTAVFGGGCFWGLQDLIRKQPGVINTIVGYTGGENDDPTYKDHPGHAEAVEIEYDDTKTSYKKLLNFFFQIHNLTILTAVNMVRYLNERTNITESAGASQRLRAQSGRFL